jgi:hypothetical protein
VTCNPLRQCLAIALSATCPASIACGQDIRPLAPAGPAVVRPYIPVAVPAARLTDSTRLGNLIRAGILCLSAQDAIALALAGCGKTPFFGQIRNLYYAESKTD